MTAKALRCFVGIVEREFLRFLRQRSRFFASLVRPLVWLVIFGTGLRSMVDLSGVPPYDTTVAYEAYIVPGLVGLILLFNGMQIALSMVFDREMGSMKVLLVSPLPRGYLLTCRLMAGVIVALPQVYAFLACAWLWGVQPPAWGYLTVLPAVVLAGLMLGAVGLLLSSLVEQLENFAGVMNFVIFPVFFASTALYPLWRLSDTNAVLAEVARLNPFSHAVELVRFALYGRLETTALLTTAVVAVAAMALAVWRYDSGRILQAPACRIALGLPGGEIGKIEDVGVGNGLHDIAHRGVVAGPYVGLVLAHGLDEEILALSGDPRDVVAAGQVRTVADVAAMLVNQAPCRGPGAPDRSDRRSAGGGGSFASVSAKVRRSSSEKPFTAAFMSSTLRSFSRNR